MNNYPWNELLQVIWDEKQEGCFYLTKAPGNEMHSWPQIHIYGVNENIVET